jgi:hypothetical protein
MAEIEGFSTPLASDGQPATSHPFVCCGKNWRCLKNEVADMMEFELIIPSYGAWTKPMLFLQKKDGSFTTVK